MRLAILIAQSVMLILSLLFAILWATGKTDMIILLLLALLAVGFTNYIGPTIFKFSRTKNKRLINIHWMFSSAYLLIAALIFLLDIKLDRSASMFLVLVLPWLFPLLFWYILFMFYKHKI